MGNNRKIRSLTAASVIVLGMTLTACELPDESGTAADRADTTGSAKDKVQDKVGKAKQKADKKADGANENAAAEEPAAPKETSGQANARESAASYLDYSAFSRSGLIQQLKYEGFSQADAEYGTDAQKANYKKQAALSAKQYLDQGSFSRQGLIDQLKYEGYTPEQAEAGVSDVGL